MGGGGGRSSGCCGGGVGLLRGQARHDTIARIVDSGRVLGDSIVLYL